MENSFNYQAETENLAFMWNRHSREFLTEYLQKGLFNSFINPQQFLTRNIIASNIFGKEISFPRLATAVLRAFFSIRFAKGFFSESILRNAFENSAAGVAETLERRNYRTSTKSRQISVIDIGCGSGNYYKGFVKSGLSRYINYIGVDIAGKNIANANLTFPGIDFRIGNILSLDFGNDYFDVVLVGHVFEHLHPDALGRAVRECLRVSRSTLIFNFFCEKDIVENIILPLERYHWNMLARNRMLSIIGNSSDIKIVDDYRSFGADKIRFIDKRGYEQSYSTYVIRKNSDKIKHGSSLI